MRNFRFWNLKMYVLSAFGKGHLKEAREQRDRSALAEHRLADELEKLLRKRVSVTGPNYPQQDDSFGMYCSVKIKIDEPGQHNERLVEYAYNELKRQAGVV